MSADYKAGLVYWLNEQPVLMLHSLGLVPDPDNPIRLVWRSEIPVARDTCDKCGRSDWEKPYVYTIAEAIERGWCVAKPVPAQPQPTDREKR